ncbi:MAG TPA: SURF1 family protein [Candidatus Methylomirabilis sp.]|nr:SURF1 family protein [Candidatus Methylomirabilis sp.]
MSRLFRPSAAASIATAVLLPLLLYLGYWQLQRADEKRLLQAEYDARSDGPAIQVESRVQNPGELQFYRVVAKGDYETDYQILLDNRVHQGQPGYDVITPLHLPRSDVRLLVNRGWIPLGTDRAHPPAIETPKGQVEIAGVATVPAENVFTLGAPEPLDRGWQKVWQNMDMKRYRAAVPFPVQPVVVLLDPQSSAGGFTREWARLDAGIAVHEGYAFQWFMMAAALVVIYLFMGRRRAKAASPEDNPS